jgi:predicted nucleic acid-binding protein
MIVRSFVDTNILIYAAMARLDAPAKTNRANELIGSEPFAISGQVLAEFYRNVTRKGASPLSPVQALEWIERLSKQVCIPVDATLVRNGILLSERYRIDYWDAAIVAAAEMAGAETLYSEDLNHGQVYGSVMVVNPFL